LELTTHIDLDHIGEGITVRLIRLIASACLETEKEWSAKRKAIIDTANPVSLIPYSIWSRSRSRWLSARKSRLLGIGSGYASGRLGEVNVVLLDDQNVSPVVRMKAYLLDDDNTPFLIGFEDVLTDFCLFCDYKTNIAYLET
jgi:hypothetical protein